jgi:hypothetical protein
MKIRVKYIGYIALLPLIAAGLILIILYTPLTGDWIGRKVIRHIGKTLKLDIDAEHLKLSFPLDLSLHGLSARSSGDGDTLLSFSNLRVCIMPGPLLAGIVFADTLSIHNLRLATGNFIEGIELNGNLDTLFAQAMIRLRSESATIRSLSLSDANIHLQIDTIQQEDTDPVPVSWTIDAGHLLLNRIRFAMQIPSDTLSIAAGIEQGELIKAAIDLGNLRYTADHLRLTDASFLYDGNNLPPDDGLDYMHLYLSKINASVDSILYQGKSLNVWIRNFAAAERSGLEVLSLDGRIGSDNMTISIPALHIQTPASSAVLQATVPWSIGDDRSKENMRVTLNTSIGKNDLQLWNKGSLPDFWNAYPDIPLSLNTAVEGNLSLLNLHQLTAELPDAFTLSVSGQARNIRDSLYRSAQIQMEAQIRRLDFALNLLPASQRGSFHIPEGLMLSGDAGLNDSELNTNLLLSEDAVGAVALKARYHMLNESYEATLSSDSLSPVLFMPSDSLMRLSALLHAEGKGTDLFADSTHSILNGHISDLRYASTEINDIHINASLKDHHAKLGLKSIHPFADMDITFDGSLYPKSLKGMWIGNIDSLDLQQLNLTDMPAATSFQLFAEMESDLHINHQADLTLGNWELNLSDQYIRPKTLTLHARSDEDTTRLSFHAGDFGVILTGNTDIETMNRKLLDITSDIKRQIRQDSSVNIASLRHLLPDMNLTISAGKDNPVYNVLRQYDIDMDAFRLDASSSPQNGLRMDAALYTLFQDTFRIDTIRASIRPDSMGLNYHAEIIKNKYRRQEAFTAEVNGSLQNRYADAEFLYANSKEKTGLRLGVRGNLDAGDVLIRFFPENPIIAFNTFTLNTDNYIRFRNKKDIDANVFFTGEANSSLWLHSHKEAEEFPELHAELNRIDMNVLSNGFANMPRMRGMMSANLRYAPSAESFMVVSDVHIDSLFYEDGEVGELLLNTVYLPLDENTHQVDAHFYHNRKETASATAVYEAQQEYINGSMLVDTLPMYMFTPFIPEKMASLNGALNGKLTVTGTPDKPVINGYMQLDTASVYTGIAASRFHLDNRKLGIENNHLLFDSFKVFSAGTNPLMLHGNVNFSDREHIMANLQLKGNNIQALDVKKNPESLVYGRLLLNADASVQGRIEALNIRGNIQLLGGTNLTYIMKESPLTVQDRLKDLITFTSFTDTIIRRRRRPGNFMQMPATGMDMLMTIHIDPIVQLHADLTPDRSGFVSLEGGGDLSFQYTRQGDMLLNGRYTLSGGRLKYALPVIPLKEFSIKDNSYIQWDGDPLNPVLSLDATQRMRTSVSLLDETPRVVNFDVGINVKQRLENMSLLFTIAAPEDKSVQEELDRMGAEGRSTQAVAMMVTGLYLAGGNNGKVNLNVGNALGSFLQNEINNIVGDVIKNVDISVGMNTYNDAELESGQRTDYSFRFAKRFYNDRLRAVVGGKVSTGDARQKESFIDNASLEWRINEAGTGYLKLFYDKNYQSILDGEVTETGLGVVFRRRMRYWYELFK